ncbi:Uncharacterised protein [Mycolicibacterium vanbaalenii]|uniref:Anti-sigma factor antagonist n=1 Tax=Mycolicibacterium vanbaalenii TaxID=110539 RepID=A0A5S9NU41_MYCVN|nr:anti-sigma factor antagonist [Mycolicibacterium vanbaalenii]CAA0094236.1 Uncharacterised protein [Mycolicibacterium vanbaalenii]
MGLDVRQEVCDAAVVVSAGGHVDSVTVDAFQTSLQAALDVAATHSAKKLVIELEDLSYFGSAGLNAVLACHERGAADGVAVRVVAVNPMVVRPLQITKLDSVIRPYPSVGAAIDGG